MIKTLTFFISMQTMFSKNHMNMLFTVICSCFLLSISMFFMSTTHWFSLMLVLIYISGIMVLFMFIVSLAPNEKNYLKNKKTSSTIIILSSLLISMNMNSLSSESLKTNSSMKNTLIPMMFMVLILAMMAYIPPKLMKSFYKGMKTSK